MSSVLQVLAILLAVVWEIPVTPGEPYGVGDVLDLFFAFLVLVVSGLCAVLRLVLLAFPGPDGRGLTYRAILVRVGSFAGYQLLHSAVPRLM